MTRECSELFNLEGPSLVMKNRKTVQRRGFFSSTFVPLEIQHCAIDLCSGAGGVTTGFKRAGLAILAAVDTDGLARESYAINHPEVRLYSNDLLELRPETLLSDLELSPGDLDILTACVPCQTYSSLNRRREGADDPRERLVDRVADFVEVIRPKSVVMENVPLLLRDQRFKDLVERLRAMSYGIWAGVVNAEDFGVPQRRRRLVLIALRDRNDREVPPLSNEHPALRGFCERKTVRDAFRLLRHARADDPLAVPRRDYPAVVAKRIAAIPRNGGSRGSLPRELQLTCHRGRDNREFTAAGNVYGRMSLDEVAPTLTTRCVTPSCGRYLHPWANRAITLREAACLQSFPVDYEFKGGVTAVEAQIGNAVPPRLAEAVAMVLRELVKPSRLVRAPVATSEMVRKRMRAVKRRDTPAELVLRSALHRQGLRFRVNLRPIRRLRRTADIVFIRAKIAVFVDGCFWHGCPIHQSWPRSNGAWWRQKIQATQRRDAETNRLLTAEGWLVVRVWEHEDLLSAAARIAVAVEMRSGCSSRGSDVLL